MSQPPKKLPKRKPKRKAALPGTGSNVHPTPYLKGVPVTDPQKLIAKASQQQIDMLKHSNFALWSAYSGIEVDQRKFEFDLHRYLLPIYLCEAREMVWMKSAQMGATIYEVLRLLWFCRYHMVKAALYFPTSDGVTKLAKDRLNPIILSNDELRSAVDQHDDALGLKHIENIYGKKSSLYMLYLGGTASKDSVPLDVMGFDEVRLCNEDDIDQALERVSHSTFKYRMYVSTAGHPNCFAGDTMIVVRDKRNGVISQQSISTLVDTYRNYQALSYNRRGGNRTRWRDITGAVCRGVRPMVRVKFWNGHEIQCTPEHRFAKLGHEVPTIGWLPITDVERYPKRFGGTVGPSGVLCVNSFNQRVNPRWGCPIADVMAPYTLSTFRVLGAYIAEGTLNVSGEIQVWQSKDTKGMKTYVSEWAKNEGLTFRITSEGVFVQAGRRPDLVKLFKSCGQGALNKRIPECVISGSPEQLSVLLEGLLDGDGHRRSPRKSSRASNREFDYFTSSIVLAHQLLFLGQRLGTPFSIQTRQPRGERFIGSQRVYSENPQYIVSYNPKSFRSKEVFPELGQLAVSSVEPSEDALAYDLEIEGTPWFTLAGSGCLVHNSDIHARFLRGDQQYWHIRCNCPSGMIPSECFPDCIIVTSKKEVHLRCPKCKMIIKDPQIGSYIAHNPGADFPSFHVSQFISKFISPKEIWDHYNASRNKKEFYNAKLGKPFIDKENVPIDDDVLENCVNTDIRWLVNEHVKDRRNCAMGIDQHGGNVFVVIAKHNKDGKKQIVHLEIVESNNPQYWEGGKPVTPFKRVHQLMKEFDVGMCVIDAMPNYNEAAELARTFPGRVFIAWYGGSQQKDMVLWHDRARLKEGIRRGSKSIKVKWQVSLNRYTSIDFALQQFVNRNVEMPHPDALVQVCRTKEGRWEAENICRTQFWLHLQSIVRQKKIIDESTGNWKMEWVYLGLDPHFVHTWSYCCVALERLKRRAIIIM